MTTEKRTGALFVSGLVWASVAALVGGLACSEEPEDGGLVLGQGIAGSGSGGAPSSSTGGRPNAPGSGIAGSLIINPGIGISGGGGASGGGLEACATGKAKADITPVSMFITFDRSTSMNESNKWGQAVEALNAFFADPGTKGLKVALRFFPHDLPEVGCSGAEMQCSVDACAKPLVPLAELTADAAPVDAHEQALIAAVNSSAPLMTMPGMMGGGFGTSGGTPISAALAGALKWAVDNQQQRADERTVVVLVTDGDPTTCDTNVQNIAELARTGFADFNIPTYVIGIQGATQRNLDVIARAGGTTEAFFSDNAMTAQQDLITALNAIRGTVLSCAFPLPTGANSDPTKVNVTFTGSTGTGETLPQTNEQACGTGQGWYYDNPTMPRTITLCPSTCDRVQADTAAKLDVVLGCSTMVR